MNFSDKIKKFLASTWEYIKTARIELIVLAAVLAADLIVKGVIDATMSLDQSVTVIPNFFNIRYVHNYYAAFGSAFGLEKVLGDVGIRVIFLIITVLAVGFFAVFMYKSRGKHLVGRLGMALIIAGALGNFVDRLFLGYVRDFAQIVFFGLDLPLLGKSFAIFNLADVALIAGVILFLIYFIFYYQTKNKPEEQPVKTEFELVETADGGGTDAVSAAAPAPKSPGFLPDEEADGQAAKRESGTGGGIKEDGKAVDDGYSDGEN